MIPLNGSGYPPFRRGTASEGSVVETSGASYT